MADLTPESLVPHLQTRRVMLRPAGPEAGRTIYGFLADFGTTVLGDPDVFAGRILADVSANGLFTVHLRRSDEVIGFALLQKFRPGRHVEVGIYTEDARTPLGAGAEATLLLVNYAFAALGVRKVYTVTTEHSREGFGIAFAGDHRELVLPGHFYFQGELWDAHYYAMSRDEWLASGARYLERLVPKPTAPTTGAA